MHDTLILLDHQSVMKFCVNSTVAWGDVGWANPAAILEEYMRTLPPEPFIQSVDKKLHSQNIAECYYLFMS